MADAQRPAVGHDYPDQFPIDDIRTVIDYLRGRNPVGVGGVVHAGYHILGYALGQVFGNEGVGAAPGGPHLERGPESYEVLGNDQVAAELEGLAALHDKMEKSPNPPVGWSPPSWLVSLALDVLRRILDKLSPA